MRLPGVLLLALVTLPGSAGATADFWVAAFGDSITEGCCDRPFADGGYPERLAKLWGCVYFQAPFPPPDVGTPVPCPVSVPYPGCAQINPPGTCGLANRGKSGEKAVVEGVTRFQNVVLPEWDWDVILLMEGTNDLGDQNVSIATVKAALATMDEAAADQGVDVVHAPVVEYHPYALSYTAVCQGVPGYNPRPWLEPNRQALHAEVVNLATTRNRYLSDQSERVCPSVGLDFHGHPRDSPAGDCFDYDYGEKCGIGHPSGSSDNPNLGANAWQYDGYDNMAAGFFADLTTPPLPGTAAPMTPAGAVCGNPPSYNWVKESNEGATFYQVEVDGLAEEWLQESDWRGPPEVVLCQPDADADDNCSWPSSVSLGAGNHSWRVRGRSPGGFGPWSAATAFEIVVAAPPQPSALSPGGELFDTTPRYEWTPVANATEYDLEVWDGSIWHDAGTYGLTSCAGNVCSAEPAAPSLTPGSRRFRVSANNVCGSGLPSAELSFTVRDCSAYPDVDLENATVTAAASHEACVRISLGNLGAGDYVVDGATADLSLYAGSTIEFHNGFSLLDGSLVATVDP